RDLRSRAEAARKREGQVPGRPLYNPQTLSPTRSVSRTTFPYVDGDLRPVAEAEFTASVHRGGDDAEDERASALAREEAAWASKVVVREPFRYHHPRDSTRLDRITHGMLAAGLSPSRKLQQQA